MTADRNDQLNYYNSLLNFYDSQADTEGNKIIQLTSDEKDIINSQVKLLEDDLASTQANVDYIKSLMLDPNTAVIVAQSGVTLNDTPQEVQTKFATYYYTQEVTQSKNEMETNGYQYMTQAQAMTKPAGEITTITDSKGVQRYWWKKAETTTNEKILDVLDYARYLELFPDAGILPTDTYEIANQKATLSKKQESTYTDEELITQFEDAKKENIPLVTVLSDINSSPSIVDKENAKKLANEVFSKTETPLISSTSKVGKATSSIIEPFKSVAEDIGKFSDSVYKFFFK
jgi:hypothetical protein